MITRIVTAVVALAVFFAVILAPPIVFPIALAAVVFMMLIECYNATKAPITVRVVGFICAALLFLACIPFALGYDYHIEVRLSALAALTVIVVSMAEIVILHGKFNYKEVLSNAFLTIYITVCAVCILVTKAYFGTAYMLVIFLAAWSCDTFAYFTGKFLGKHKLIPHVSPNKTVEGAIGGVLGAVISCMVYFFIRDKMVGVNVPWAVIGAVTGFVGGAFSQLGDLIASSIKRDTGVKDFGFIFPGHGGFFDRFDSVIFIAPIMLGVFMLIQTFMAA